MTKVAIRPKARFDLDDIWDYTIDAWGRDQAKIYLRAINHAFQKLAKNPHLGKKYDGIHEGLRAYPSGKHLIFYFKTNAGIDIVRILHERMDIISQGEDVGL